MIIKFNEFIHESHELDPYNEEDWGVDLLEQYFNLLKNIDSVKHVKFLTSESDTIMYLIDYPNKRGVLEFYIMGLTRPLTMSTEIILVWDEGRKHVNLKECTEKELWDKMTYLVEGI